MRKGIQKMVDLADEAYPDGLIGDIGKGIEVDDTLALFIRRELISGLAGYSDKELPRRAVELMGKAIDELKGVVRKFEEYEEAVLKNKKGLKPFEVTWMALGYKVYYAKNAEVAEQLWNDDRLSNEHENVPEFNVKRVE